jgi:hypothetical protein
MVRWTPPQASMQIKTEENGLEQAVEKIIERNLLEVFNRRDAESRRAAILGRMDRPMTRSGLLALTLM